MHDAIHKIPANPSWHLDYKSPYSVPKPAYDAHTAKSACITRNGGTKPHPSGKRPFTPREMASLQGFRETYEFTGSGITQVKTQIGNAIPPNVWAHYIRACVVTLEQFDAGVIDETGRSIVKREEAAKREEAGPSSRFSTPSCNLIKSEKKMPMYSSGTSGFSDPSSSNSSSAFSNPSTSSPQHSDSMSLRNLYRTSPSPAPRKIRAWTEEYLDLPSEPFEPAPSTHSKGEMSSIESRASPFKRKIEPIDLTGERKKMKNKACIDLTEEDGWEMIEDW